MVDSEAEILNLLSVGDNEVRRGQIYFSNEAGQPALWIQGFSGGKAEIKTTSGADRIIKIYNTQVGKKLSLDLDDGDLTTTGNFTGNQIYGEMWFHSHTAGTTSIITTQNVPVNVSGFSIGVETGNDVNGFLYDSDYEWLSCLVDGKYKADYQLSFSNAGNNEEYMIMLAVNNVLQNNTATHRKIGSGGDVGNTAGFGNLNLNKYDNVSMKIINVDGSNNVIGHSASVNLMRIGD